MEKFSIGKLSPKNAAIDFKKLDHFSGLHVRNLSVEELAGRIKPFIEKEGYSVDEEALLKLTPLLQPRLITLDEVPNWVRFIFVDEVSPEAEDLIPKGLDAGTALTVARRMLEILESADAFTHEEIEQPIRDLAEELGLKLGQVFHVLRMAVAAQPVTPPLIESMDILGKEKTISRMRAGVELLEGIN